MKRIHPNKLNNMTFENVMCPKRFDTSEFNQYFEITPRTYEFCKTKMFCIRWKISCAWPSSLPIMSNNEERWHYGLYVLYSSDSVTVGTSAELKLSGLKKLGRGPAI